MVMRPDVMDAAIGSVADERPLIVLTPRGAPLTQKRVQELAAGPGVILLCGRYEGIDQRVIEAREAEEISIGDYVLSGGEIAALALLDAVIRLLPGVMGAAESADRGKFFRPPARIPALHPPGRLAGRAVPENPALRQPRRHRRLAARKPPRKPAKCADRTSTPNTLHLAPTAP